MTVTAMLVLAPLLVQGPQGGAGATAQGEFRWPPPASADRPLRYEATLTKRRSLSRELARAERAARKSAGLYAPARTPPQAVTVTLDVELRSDGDRVLAKYATKLGKTSLRIRPVGARGGADAGTGDAAAPRLHLGNDRLADLWGLPDAKGAERLAVPRAAMQRSFEQSFARRGKAQVAPAVFDDRFGDHLLPVLWSYALPCWVEQLLAVMDLGAEGAIIAGKTLISDRSESAALGQRETRVELKFTEVSAAAFTIKYELAVEQQVGKTRDGAANASEPFVWRFEIDGEATYSMRDAAFESIREKIEARPLEPGEQLLANLRDEAFVGEISIRRVEAQPRGRRRRR